MFTIRPAREDDYPDWVAFFRALETPDDVYTREQYAARIVPSAFFVCEGERLVGYGYGMPMGARWYVMHVVTAEGARGRGVGRVIMDEHARRARTVGLARWMLNVKRDNGPAIRLYERCGMRVAAATWAMIVDWAGVARLPPSPPHTTEILDAKDDAVVERTFGHASGEIAGQRARQGRVIVAVRAEGAIVAWASFVPDFPGSFPFRTRGAEWNAALLGAMRPHARPTDARVRLVIEDDEAAMRDVVAAGGEVLLSLFRMEGALDPGDR
jgi:GNAT superfamily N-acetyltransferase